MPLSLAMLVRALALFAPLACGCVSMMSYGSARTLPPGRFEVFVAPEYPRYFENGVRFGVTDRFELALRLPAPQIEAKVQIERSETPHRGVDVAIAPSLGWPAYREYSEDCRGDCWPPLLGLWLRLPLLIGLNIGGGSQVALGPAVTGFFDP